MRVPDHRGFGSAHSRPALQCGKVLVYDSHHHRPNIKGFLSSGICRVGKNLPNLGEAVAVCLAVRINLHVAVDGIGRHSLPRESLARSYIGVLVVAKKNMTGFIDILAPSIALGRSAP